MKSYRQASLQQSKGQGQVTAFCPACMDRNRRGGQATFKGTDSVSRNRWWERHSNHHNPKPALYGVRP